MGTYRYNPSTGNLDLISGGTLYADMAVGSIIPSGRASDNPAAGYLYCDGSAVSRTEYAELFSAIGTAFGSGNGSTTFNIPDLRGEFIRGAGTNSHTDQGNGGSVGAHQNGTEIPMSGAGGGADSNYFYAAALADWKNPDRSIDTGVKTKRIQFLEESPSLNNYNYHPRPTNTSVNFFIKAKQVAVPADFAEQLQPRTLDTPITIGGQSKTTVEGALNAIVEETTTKKQLAYNTDITELDAGILYYTVTGKIVTYSGHCHFTAAVSGNVKVFEGLPVPTVPDVLPVQDFNSSVPENSIASLSANGLSIRNPKAGWHRFAGSYLL